MDINKLIEQEKARQEAEFQAKIEASRAPNVDVRDFFTDEELARILADDHFQGRVAELSKVKRYEELRKAANWIFVNCIDCSKLDVESVSSGNRNVGITLSLHRFSSFSGEAMKMLRVMFTLADSVYFSAIKEDEPLLSFSVMGVWAE